MPEPNVRSHGTKIALLIVGGIATINDAVAINHTADVRVSRVLSVRPATSTSRAAMLDRYPAPNSPAKNNRPKTHPAGIAAKTLGSVENSSPGPCAGAMWSAKTAGTIANPASRDVPVSPMTVQIAGRATFSRSDRYDP